MSVSRPGLHWLLWQRQGGAETLRVDQTKLAEEIGITRFQLNRILGSMDEDGRIRKLSSAGPSARLFEIRDPALFVSPPQSGPRRDA